MATRLDRNRSYGEIHPPLEGAFYEQDGIFFDSAGNFLRDPTGKRGAAKSAPSAPKVQAPPADIVDDVDLAAWARKEKNYPFFSVKKAILEKFPEANVDNTKTIVETLVDKGIVTADEATR